MSRVLLFTGKGGVGKTTAAAATATLSAALGHKVLVVSTDPAHSLADAFDVSLPAEPTEVDPGLYGLQVDAQGAFERTWTHVRHSLRGVLERAGLDGLQPGELPVLPGAPEVLALLEVRRQVTSGLWDLVVVDCPPTGETLRLLALPEALSWYGERVFPAHRRAVRPLLSRSGGPAVPPDALFDAVTGLSRELDEVREVLTGPAATVRLVLTPEAVVVAETRRALTSLALYGYRVDGLIVNRVFPAGSGEPWVAGWVQAQAAQLAAVRADAAGLPVAVAPYRAAEPVGVGELLALGKALHGEQDPAAPAPPDGSLQQVRRTSDGYLLFLALPLARLDELDLARSGDQLVVTVAGRRRLLTLPSALRRCTVAGATLVSGQLLVRFEPDPALWPDGLTPL